MEYKRFGNLWAFLANLLRGLSLFCLSYWVLGCGAPPPTTPLPGALLRLNNQVGRSLCRPIQGGRLVVDLHAHPFERILRRRDELRTSDIGERNEMTFNAMRTSGVDIHVATMVLPEITELTMKYVRLPYQASNDPGVQALLAFFRERVHREIAEEMFLNRELIAFENQLVRQCWSPTRVHALKQCLRGNKLVPGRGRLSLAALNVCAPLDSELMKVYQKLRRLLPCKPGGASKHRKQGTQPCLEDDIKRLNQTLHNRVDTQYKTRNIQTRLKSYLTSLGLAGCYQREHWQQKKVSRTPVEMELYRHVLMKGTLSVKPKLRQWVTTSDLLRWDSQNTQLSKKRLLYFQRYVKERMKECREDGVFGPEFVLARTPQEAQQALVQKKKVFVVNLEQLGFLRDAKDVDFFWKLGARMATLAHLSDNCLSASAHIPWLPTKLGHHPDQLLGHRYVCLPKTEVVKRRIPAVCFNNKPTSRTYHLRQNTNQGLTEQGLAVMRRMLALGMVVDLSHMSDTSVQQVLGCRDSHPKFFPPQLYTHTNFRYIKGAWTSDTRKLLASQKRHSLVSGYGPKAAGEYALSHCQVRRITQNGGMVGIELDQRALEWTYHLKRKSAAKAMPRLKFDPLYYRVPDEQKSVLRALLHDMRLFMRATGSSPSQLGAFTLGTDYNGFVHIPESFTTIGHLSILFAMLQREDCKIYESFGASGHRFLKLWQKAMDVSQRWKKLPASEHKNICSIPVHKHCPWHPERRKPLRACLGNVGICEANESFRFMGQTRFQWDLHLGGGALIGNSLSNSPNPPVLGVLAADLTLGMEAYRPADLTDLAAGFNLVTGVSADLPLEAVGDVSIRPFFGPSLWLYASVVSFNIALAGSVQVTPVLGGGFRVFLDARYSHVRYGVFSARLDYNLLFLSNQERSHVVRLMVGYNFASLL